MGPRKTLITDVSSADILLAVMEPGEGGRDHHGDEIRLNELTWTRESKTSLHNEKGIARLLTDKERKIKKTQQFNSGQQLLLHLSCQQAKNPLWSMPTALYCHGGLLNLTFVLAQVLQQIAQGKIFRLWNVPHFHVLRLEPLRLRLPFFRRLISETWASRCKYCISVCMYI